MMFHTTIFDFSIAQKLDGWGWFSAHIIHKREEEAGKKNPVFSQNKFRGCTIHETVDIIICRML